MILKTELSTDPLARGYAAMTTDQTLGSLQAQASGDVIGRVLLTSAFSF